MDRQNYSYNERRLVLSSLNSLMLSAKEMKTSEHEIISEKIQKVVEEAIGYYTAFLQDEKHEILTQKFTLLTGTLNELNAELANKPDEESKKLQDFIQKIHHVFISSIKLPEKESPHNLKTGQDRKQAVMSMIGKRMTKQTQLAKPSISTGSRSIESTPVHSQSTPSHSPTPVITQTRNLQDWCFGVPRKIESVDNWKTCYGIMLDNNKQGIRTTLVCNCKSDNVDISLGIESIFAKCEIDLKTQSQTTWEQIYKKIESEYKEISITFRLVMTTSDIEEKGFYFAMPIQIQNSDDLKYCYEIMRENATKNISTTMKIHYKDFELNGMTNDIEPFIKKYEVSQEGEINWKQISSEFIERNRDIYVEFHLTDKSVHLEMMSNTIQNLSRYGIVTQERGIKLGLVQTLSNDRVISGALGKIVCLNYVFSEND